MAPLLALLSAAKQELLVFFALPQKYVLMIQCSHVDHECAGLGQSNPSGAGPAVGIFPNRDHGISQQGQQSSYQAAPGQQTTHTSYEAVHSTPGQQTYTSGHAQQTYPSGM